MSQFSELLANERFLETAAELLNEPAFFKATESEIRSRFVANGVEIPPSHKMRFAPANGGHQREPQPMVLSICIYDPDYREGVCIEIDADGIHIYRWQF